MSKSTTPWAIMLAILTALLLVGGAVRLSVWLAPEPSGPLLPTEVAQLPVPGEPTAPPNSPIPTSTLPPAPTATTAPTATAGPTPTDQTGTKYGLHLLLDDGRNHWPPEVWPQHVQAARRIVGQGGYVVQLIRLDDLDVARWQFFLDLCAQEQLVPIIRLAGEFDHEQKWWIAPPQDPDGQGYTEVAARVGDFFGQLRWPTTPRYVIVANEPNRGDEWSNQPNPAAYARYLIDVSAALRGVGVTVLGPALDLYAPHSNGRLLFGRRYIDAETFLDEMFAAEPGVFEAIDVWAAHAYPLDPFRFDPSRQVFQIDYAHGASNPHYIEPPPGIHNRGVNSYRWEMWKLEQIIGPKARSMPVLITESGWRHAETQDAGARDQVHAALSFETMSAYLDLAFHGNGGRYPDLPETGWTPWNDDPRVRGVVLFALGGYPPDWGHTNWVTVGERGQITGFYPITLTK